RGNDGSSRHELEKRLAEALEQQAATSEILRIIGTSPTDVQPIFDGIARSGVRLCGALGCAVFVVHGDMRHVAATHGSPPERAATPFTDQQVALLQTFADQAVIAIENVRLFKELEARNRELTEALEQQTATSEILRVISSSPTDVQPVFDAIASSALRLCDGVASFVFRHDGTLIHLAAFDSAEGVDLQPLRHIFPAPPEGVTFAGRVMTPARLLYIADIELDPNAPPTLVDFARANGFRSIFAAPMLRDGHTIGVIAVTQRDVDGFTPKQGALLETFANQAVIAIENVRLFTEMQQANAAQTEAADHVRASTGQQTAADAILGAITKTPLDVHAAH